MEQDDDRRRHFRLRYPEKEGPYLQLNKGWHYITEISEGGLIVVDSLVMRKHCWSEAPKALVWFPKIRKDKLPVRFEGSSLIHTMSPFGIYVAVKIAYLRTTDYRMVFELNPFMPMAIIRYEELRIIQKYPTLRNINADQNLVIA